MTTIKWKFILARLIQVGPLRMGSITQRPESIIWRKQNPTNEESFEIMLDSCVEDLQRKRFSKFLQNTEYLLGPRGLAVLGFITLCEWFRETLINFHTYCTNATTPKILKLIFPTFLNFNRHWVMEFLSNYMYHTSYAFWMA